MRSRQVLVDVKELDYKALKGVAILCVGDFHVSTFENEVYIKGIEDRIKPPKNKYSLRTTLLSEGYLANFLKGLKKRSGAAKKDGFISYKGKPVHYLNIYPVQNNFLLVANEEILRKKDLYKIEY